MWILDYSLYLHHNNKLKFNNYSNDNKNKQIGSNEKGLGDIQNVKRIQFHYKEIYTDDKIIFLLPEKRLDAN